MKKNLFQRGNDCLNKKYYVTKSDVDSYINYTLKRLGYSYKELLNEIEIALSGLKEYPKDNSNQIRFFTKVYSSLYKRITLQKGITEIEYHRKPTASEIKFGEGATHYKDFNLDACMKDNGDYKEWLICPIDKLRYYR